MSEEKHPMIYGLMSKIMGEIGPIAKDQTNAFQKYKFRGIDDIYNAVQSILAKHGVVPIPFVQGVERNERPGKEGGTLMFTLLTVDYTFYAPDGSHVVARMVGEAMDSSDKSTNKALSAAEKYLFVQTFCIPTTEIKDSEHDNPEPTYKKRVDKETGEVALPKSARGSSSMETVPEPDWEDLITAGKPNRWPTGYIKQWLHEQKATNDSLEAIYERGKVKFSRMNTKAEAVV